MRCLGNRLTSKFTSFKHRYHLCTFRQSSSCSNLFLAKDPIPIAEALSFSLNSNSSTLGTQIHGYVIKLGFNSDVFTQNNLIRTYTKGSHLHYGCKVFDEMPQRNVVSWALLISGAVQCLVSELALETFIGMTRTGLMPNEFVLGSVMKGCTYMEAGGFGVSVHCWSLKSGFESNPYVGSSMLSFYCKMEDIEAAERIFKSMEKVDVGCWNAILGGYAKYGYGHKALRIASSMRFLGLRFDQYTFISSLHGSSTVFDLDFGKQIHGLILRTAEGSCSTTSVMNALMDMYTKNGVADYAMKVFRVMVSKDIVTWNTAFGSNGSREEVVSLFRNFMLTGLRPNHITFSLLFRHVDVKLGLQLCSLAIHFGLFHEVTVSSSLVNMFSRCGLMQMASLVVDKLDIICSKDIVIWNELISGYNSNDDSLEALLTFSNLKKAKVQPDEYTYSHILETCYKYGCQRTIQQIHGAVIKSGFASHIYICSSLIKGYADKQEAIRCFKSLLESGEKPDEFILCSIRIKAAHPFVVKLGYDSNVFVSSAMLDAYAKSGDIKSSRTIFDQSGSFYDVVLYNAMMMAYAHHGLRLEAFEIFEKMKLANLQPNQATFVSLISACGHLGMVDKGCLLFESMKSEYGLEPSPDNYGCLVDMFARNGHLEAAKRVMETMPFAPWPEILRALLSGCRMFGDKEVGEWAVTKMVRLDATTRALWLKVHSESGDWEEVANINKAVSETDLGKIAGQSWIEVHG
ncbi:Pentatricopeptide repeat-containing protein At3g09040, mitochondrial [Linum grandiflorum]